MAKKRKEMAMMAMEKGAKPKAAPKKLSKLGKKMPRAASDAEFGVR